MLPPPWSVWEDLPCGCSRSSRGSWIVSTACEEHERWLPNGVTTLLPPTLNHQYGPFRPVNG